MYKMMVIGFLEVCDIVLLNFVFLKRNLVNVKGVRLFIRSFFYDWVFFILYCCFRYCILFWLILGCEVCKFGF